MCAHPHRAVAFEPTGARRPLRRGVGAGAFSLIEVTIALGIFSFAIIPIIGLVSLGMGTLRDSMDVTVQTELIRKTVVEAMRIPFVDLAADFNNQRFYFDDEGVQQSSRNAQTIFVAQTVVSAPPTLLAVDGTLAQLLQVTVHHVADTENKTVFSQLIVNTAQ